MSSGRVVTATVLFTDVVDSTLQRIALGDDVADEVALAHDRDLRATVSGARGRVVKGTGDGLMAIFDSASDAIAAAVAVQQRTELENRSVPEAKRLALRIGISAGDVQSVEDDYHGTPVVEAKRLEGAAEPGQILVSEKVRSLAGSRSSHGYVPVGALELKGLSEPIVAYAVNWEHTPALAPASAIAVRAADDAGAPARERAPERRSRTRPARWVAIVSAVVLLAIVGVAIAVVVDRSGSAAKGGASASAGPTGYEPRFAASACPAQSGASSCGHLIVPEDRSRPDGRKVSLSVAITKAGTAVGTRATVPPTVWLGSPSPTGAVAGGETVAFAQRGWDGSTPDLTCREIAAAYLQTLALEHPAGALPSTVGGQFATAVRTCHDRYARAGIDLAAYTREASADDLRDLAVAMGWKQVNVEAGSNSTGIALVAARRYPDLVRAVVIEDPPSPDETDFSALVETVGRAWQQYLGECNAAPRCRARFGDLSARFASVYTTLNARPVTVPVALAGGPNIRVRVDGDLAAQTAAQALKTAPALPLIASVVASGDPGIIGSYLASLVWQSRTFPYGAYLNDACQHALGQLNRVELSAGVTAFPQFRGLAQDPRLDACAQWDPRAAQLPASDASGAPISAPALVVGGELNPESSPEWARGTAAEFVHSTVVIAPSLTQFPFLGAPPCLAHLRASFLADPESAIDAAGCVRQIPPVAFSGA